MTPLPGLGAAGSEVSMMKMTDKRLTEIEERSSFGLDTRDLIAALREERARADRMENQFRELLDNLKATIGAATTRLTDSLPLPAKAEPEAG